MARGGLPAHRRTNRDIEFYLGSRDGTASRCCPSGAGCGPAASRVMREEGRAIVDDGRGLQVHNHVLLGAAVPPPPPEG